MALLFLPFLDIQMVRNLLESIDLYFRMFEFNASIYYLIRGVGYWLTGYNVLSTIGLWISVFTAGTIWTLAFRRSHPPATRILWMITVYFAMATTVHPWYVSSLVMVAVFCVTDRWQFRYPLLWSGTIWLSYSAYRQLPVREDNLLLTVEYGTVLAILLLDLYRYTASRKAHAKTPAEV